jgi:DNA-binding LacI/PurR family transcriptional regulator
MASRAALPDFVRACVRKGVRTVLVVTSNGDTYGAQEMLRVAEIRTTVLEVANAGSPESVSQNGFNAILKWFADGGPRADVILFEDDYAAQGGLIALKALGLRIPEDVAVVSHTNKGHGPFWEKPLSRLEMDPVAHGRILASTIAGYLRGEPFPRNLRLGSVWREGETF